VPTALVDRWSSRSRQITEEASRKGLRGAEGRAIAALSTREAKKATPMKELFSTWTKEARESGFTQESVPTGKASHRNKEKEIRKALEQHSPKSLAEVPTLPSE